MGLFDKDIANSSKVSAEDKAKYKAASEKADAKESARYKSGPDREEIRKCKRFKRFFQEKFHGGSLKTYAY